MTLNPLTSAGLTHITLLALGLPEPIARTKTAEPLGEPQNQLRLLGRRARQPPFTDPMPAADPATDPATDLALTNSDHLLRSAYLI